jgi:hypothetical protein
MPIDVMIKSEYEDEANMSSLVNTLFFVMNYGKKLF